MKRYDEMQNYNFGYSGSRGATPVGVIIGIIVILLSFFVLAFVNLWLGIFGLLFGLILMSAIKIAAEWERVIILRLGKFMRTAKAGMFFIIPVFEQTFKVDLRTRVWDVQPQEIMSADFVPVEVDAVVYYKISDPEKAIMNVEDYANASVKMAQTTLRDIVGKSDLDRLLTKKEEIGKDIQTILDKATDPWGIHVTSVEIKDVVLPEMLKRAMAKEAEASREKKARLIKASAEEEAASKFERAAAIMMKSPAGMQLRQLQTWQEIGAEQNSLMILIPTDFAKSMETLGAAGLGSQVLKEMEQKPKQKKK